MFVGIIYKVSNTANNKVYIGQTILTLKKRWRNHITESNGGADHYFHRAIRKYGFDKFKPEMIELLQSDSRDHLHNLLNESEKRLIVAYNTKSPYGYNATDGGLGRPGCKATPETLDKMRKANTGRSMPDVAKAKISAFQKGRPKSEETKNKMSLAQLGNTKGSGKKRSPEISAKLSSLRKGIPKSPTHRAKLREAALRRKWAA